MTNSMKTANIIILGSCILISANSLANTDESWYQQVFGRDIIPEVSGGSVNSFDGWTSTKNTHYANINSTASVTIGCQGVEFDAAFSSRFDNLFSDIKDSMHKPSMVIIAAASYFIGSAYEVMGNISGEITESITGLINSCENQGKVLADFTVDQIPELGKYYCSGENGGDDRECLPAKMEKSVNTFIRNWGQDVVDKITEDLNSKTRPSLDKEKWYILGEQNQNFCENLSNPSYFHAVYAATSMMCYELHTAIDLIGNLEVHASSADSSTSQSGDAFKKELFTTYQPKISSERMFLRLSAAYGRALYEVITSEDYESSEAWYRWSRSPYTDDIDSQYLNIASNLYITGKEGRLANFIRLKADLTAEAHLKFELKRIKQFMNEYSALSGDSLIRVKDNPLVKTLEDIESNMTYIEEFRELRKEEIELINSMLE